MASWKTLSEYDRVICRVHSQSKFRVKVVYGMLYLFVANISTNSGTLNGCLKTPFVQR